MAGIALEGEVVSCVGKRVEAHRSSICISWVLVPTMYRCRDDSISWWLFQPINVSKIDTLTRGTDGIGIEEEDGNGTDDEEAEEAGAEVAKNWL